MKNFLYKMIAVLLALVFIPGFFHPVGFAQNNQGISFGMGQGSYPEARGFDKSVFDYHFSRADRELNPDSWIFEARRGIDLALNAWELFAAGLYDNPLTMEDAKKQITEWSAEELEIRFSQWLIGRFFGGAAEHSAERFSALMSDTQLRYTYHLDAEGNIVFENTNGNPSVIRPGEADHDFEHDLALWRQSAEQNIAEGIDSFETAVLRMYPELLAYIPEDMRDSLANTIAAAGTAVSASLRKEFEGLALREERLFTGRRTGDVWSLRKKSEDEAARNITARLIGETEDLCANGIAALTTRIEEAAAGAGDLALMGSEWLQMYQEQFDRGLKAWEEAEERFFIRRIEWEQEAGILFSQGEDTWLAAYNQLTEEREKWELKTKELLESGEAVFRNASKNLEAAIAEAKIEFEQNLRMRTEAGTARAQAMIDMYLTCGSGAAMARDNARFWLDRYNSAEKLDITDDSIYAWITKEEKSINKSHIFFTNNTARKQYLEEIRKSANLYRSYMSKAAEIRDTILAEYGGIMGSGALKDILSENVSTEDFILDEYQIALIRAKAAALYWERRTAIAEAVSDYAKELGAGRLTESESLSRWESAKTAYNGALVQYEEELQKLNALGMDNGEKKAALDALSQQIQEAEAELNRLNAEYSMLAAVNAVNREDYVLSEFNSKYSELIAEYDRLTQTGDAAIYKNSLDYAMRLDAIRNRETAQTILALLINGNGEDMESLAALREAVERIPVFGDDDELPGTAAAYGLVGDDPRYALIEQLLQERDRLIAAALETQGSGEFETETPDTAISEADSIKLRYNTLIRAMAAAAKAGAETALKARLAGLKLFSDSEDGTPRAAAAGYGGADWYFEAWGRIPSAAEKAALAGKNLEARLIADMENRFRELLEQRIALETGALDCLLNGITDAETNEALLSYFCLVDDMAAEKGLAAINNLRERIRRGEGYFADNEEENEIIQWFVSGGSFFAGAEFFVIEYLNNYRLGNELLTLYGNYGGGSSFAAGEAWAETVQNMRRFFSGYGIDTTGSLLPDVQKIYETILNGPGDFTSTAAYFLRDFDRQLSRLPEWLEAEINNWKTDFIEYIALTALYRGQSPGSSSAALLMEQAALEDRYNTLQGYYDSITYVDRETSRDIDQRYSAIIDDEALLSYRYLLTSAWEKNNQASADSKHWRQYLTEEYLNSADTSIAAASSWKEGMWRDALDRAALNTNRLNDIFYIYAPGSAEIGSEDANWLNGQYAGEAGKVRQHLDRITVLREELAILGRGYEYTKMNPAALEREANELGAAYKSQAETVDAARDEYFAAAQEFANTGILYDEQYAKLKAAYNDIEEKRFAYEIQDAIRRWASTAYLEIDTENATYCRERLERAEIVLTVLSNLYTDSDEARPYNNPEYAEKYSEYEQSYLKMLVSHKALNSVSAAIAKELVANTNDFDSYDTWLNKLGTTMEYPANYSSPADKSKWDVKDIITIKNGLLAFSRDSSMRLDGVDAGDATRLRNYFDENTTVNGERHKISQFELALRGLNTRMAAYFSDADKYRQWGRARDYLIRTLSGANNDIQLLANKYTWAEALNGEGSLVNTPFKDLPLFPNKFLGEYASDFQNYLSSLQQDAWNSLSETEKADLEFYVILTLSGDCNNYIDGFSRVSACEEYELAYNDIKKLYDIADSKVSKWWQLGFLFIGMRDINKSAYQRIQPLMEMEQENIQAWERGLLGNIANIQRYATAYTLSCEKLNGLQGQAAPGQGIGWNDILTSLNMARGLSSEEIAVLKDEWEAMLLDTGEIYTDVITALAGVAQWTGNIRNKSKQALDTQWLTDDLLRKNKETDYLRTVEAFINGDVDAAALSAATRGAFGKDTAAWKNHLANINTVMLNDLTSFSSFGTDFLTEFSALGGEYVSLVDGILTGRFRAELAARETEWDEQRRDIAEKYEAWQKTAALILERGRDDWKAGFQKMEAAYKRWYVNFTEEHNRISGEWAEAYLAGLEDKEQWLEQAAAAADQAAAGAMLNAVGANAERMARCMDVREPLGIRGADAAEAGDLLSELLQSPAIQNIQSGFGALNGMADLAAVTVRRGLGGAGLWDAAIVRAAASDLSRKTNAEIAAAESRKLVLTARSAAAEALKGLSADIESANSNFRKNMDNLFVVQGLWRKSGKDYIKDIIVGSTLFQPVISEEQRVEGYIDYRMEPVELKTRLDEQYLAGLDSFAIRGLIENVYLEVNAITAEVFGDGESQVISKQIWEETISFVTEYVTDPYTGETNPVQRRVTSGNWITLEDRHIGSGTFGAYIGYEPARRPGASGKNRNAIFYDQGAGEYGRLMSDYIYWSVIDSKGSAELSIAPWEKRLWDDSGSSFTAPSLRSVVDVTNQIGVAVISVVASYFSGGSSMAAMPALMAAASVADDFMFGSLDAGLGYKTIDEAGFEFGKAALISVASNYIGGVFTGASGAVGQGLTNAALRTAGSAAEKIAIQTAMTGAQTITTGIATSAISGVTYNSETKEWGYSSEIFANGVKGTMISALSSMASSLTSGTLTSINSGMNMEKLTGFSVLNQKNIGKLNNLLGAAVGQGVQYAMGEDFTLNLLNTGLLSNDYVNSGLLELRFGHDGSAKMNIGTDGMDVGINTLISSVGGALVWNVNNRIDRYTASNNFDGKVMLRAQYGHGDQKQQGQLWNILNGRDKLMVTADGDYAAETEIVDGRRVVKLSGYQSGMSDAEQMALAVILGHEAYRDGIVTNNNYLETRSATLAHTRMLERMLSGGASLSFNSNMIGDLLAYDMSDGNIDVFNAYVDSHYDSSADYWLVKMDGTIVGTPGDPRIWREIYDDNGNIQKELVPGSRESGSQAASLVALLGEDRVLQRLGLNREDALNVSSIDPELLKDVLGWTDAEVRQAIADNIKLDVNDIQRKKILGETLLKQNGYTWDDNAKTWTGTALNIADVSFRGNAGIIKDGDSYIPFAITSTMYRDANAHYLFTFNNKTKKFELSPNEKYKNNTEAFFYYRDLITGEVQQYQFEGPLNFADNADGTKFGANQAYNHPTLGTIQGATVASGQMDIRLTTSSTYGEALLFSNFTDLKGDYFGSNGMRAGNTNDPRTLYHWTIFGLSDSCLVSFDLKGGLTGKQYFNNNMNYLKNNFNLYRGYSIKNTLVDFNLNATPGGGSRAKGYKE